MTTTRQLRPAEVEVLEAALADLGYTRAPRLTVRAQLIKAIRPARTSQRDQLLGRYRWANAGLRERLAELDREHAATLDAIAVVVDEEARVIGHAHPVIARVRAQLDAAAR